MSPQSPAAIRRDEKSVAPGIMDGQRYIESLRDGREVWLHGEKVADVTEHPAFRNVVRTFADLYDLQHQAATQDIMTYVDPDGGLDRAQLWDAGATSRFLRRHDRRLPRYAR